MQKIFSYIRLKSSLAFDRLFNQKKLNQRAEMLAEMQPVIVLGRGKSGTRLLPWCLEHLGVAMSIKPGVVAGDVDDSVFRKIVKQLARRCLFVDRPEDVSNEDLELFQIAVLRLWEKMSKNPNRANAWGWKYPETYLIAPLVYRCFPNARFIHIIRDGRDVAFRQHLTDDPTTPLGYDILASLDALDKPQHIRAALSWKFQVEKYAKFTDQIPRENHFELTYEEFSSDSVETFKRVAGFLKIEMTSECAEFVRAWVKSGHVNQYLSEGEEKIEEVESLLLSTLKRFKYV